jgi:hypothetical protein
MAIAAASSPNFSVYAPPENNPGVQQKRTQATNAMPGNLESHPANAYVSYFIYMGKPVTFVSFEESISPDEKDAKKERALQNRLDRLHSKNLYHPQTANAVKKWECPARSSGFCPLRTVC